MLAKGGHKILLLYSNYIFPTPGFCVLFLQFNVLIEVMCVEQYRERIPSLLSVALFLVYMALFPIPQTAYKFKTCTSTGHKQTTRLVHQNVELFIPTGL